MIDLGQYLSVVHVLGPSAGHAVVKAGTIVPDRCASPFESPPRGTAPWTFTSSRRRWINRIAAVGSGWTVDLTSGSVTADDGSSMTLTSDAVGTITLEDGSEISFDGIERIDY